MANNHIITKNIGNLRGFSTDSLFTRPPNVADRAINIQRAPDGTLQLRRGYQCQIAQIGGMGNGTFDDPVTDEIQTVTLGLDGFLYNKLQKQIYFYYDGQVSGTITGVALTDPCRITSVAHGLSSGTFVIIRNVGGTVQLNNFTFIINVIDADHFDLYSTVDEGIIMGASQTNPCVITSIGHGLTTGNQIMIAGVQGMVNLNDIAYTITVIDPDHFSLDGIDATGFPAYVSGGMWYLAVDATGYTAFTSGGEWTINFTDQRYLTFTIFTDPRFLVTNPGWSVQPWSFSPWGAPGGESITCNITVNRAAQVHGTQSSTNTVIVQYGHEIAIGDVIQFTNDIGQLTQRTVTGVTANSITFGGYPQGFIDGVYISQFLDIPFRKGFDVVSPYLISTFIATITNPTTGVHGLQVAINGDSDLPAAFLQIIEPIIIDSNTTFVMDYWYWQQINFTISPPFPGSANPIYQNSPEMENASMAAFDDVIYVANGWDYPQKYDGQTVYRAGMPQGIRPSVEDNTTSTIKPFSSGNAYQYAISYTQVDNRGHVVEGQISEVWNWTAGATSSADVTVTNLSSSIQNNWNTNTATAVGGTATVYGPDSDGFYYDLVDVNSGFTLKIGDSAYYADTTCAEITGTQSGVITINVATGHGVVAGDVVYFLDTTPVQIYRYVDSVTSNSITIQGAPVNVSAAHPDILVYKVSKVFGNVGIVDGDQPDTNAITMNAGLTLQNGDVVEFLDTEGNLQRRNVTNVAGVVVTIDGIPVSVNDAVLFASTNQRADAITLQRENANGATLGVNAPISNNLRINIYRTLQGETFGTNGNLYLVASIPNNGLGAGVQVYDDITADAELPNILVFPDPVPAPQPPPISKYLRAFGNQLFYAGGERGNPENSDRVFFSNGNAPESVPLATNSFDVPNVDDDITGIGVAGTTLVTTKNHSLWATTGNFLTGQIETVQIAPGTNIGCVAHATIASVGTLMYFLHTNGVYSITENQLYPTDPFGNPIPLSIAIDVLFRETPYLPQTRFVFKRAVAVNYTKDNQYWLFLPCEDIQSTIRTANAFSQVLTYDYQEKNWFQWFNINAAGGMVIIDDNIYFQERRFSAVDGNTANFYKQHRFYRLVDHADHAGPQRCEWRSSWEDLGQPEVRKKFCRCILLMDRISELYQYNNPVMNFSSYVDRIQNLQNTIATIDQTDNIRNAPWSFSGWGWNFWSGYQDTFVTVNLKQGTVAKSMQVGFTIQGINMDIRLAGFQLEIIPENRKTVVR